jgi:hypothetical protein
MEHAPVRKTVVHGETLPSWLTNVQHEAAAYGGETGTSADIMDGFLEDEDMLNLEVICTKWRGLDEADLEALAKFSPKVAENLQLGEKNMCEFLNYRRQAAEKNQRKYSVITRIKEKSRKFQVDEDKEEAKEESESDLDDDSSDEENDGDKQRGAEDKQGAEPLHLKVNGRTQEVRRASQYASRKSQAAVAAITAARRLSRLAIPVRPVAGQDDNSESSSPLSRLSSLPSFVGSEPSSPNRAKQVGKQTDLSASEPLSPHHTKQVRKQIDVSPSEPSSPALKRKTVLSQAGRMASARMSSKYSPNESQGTSSPMV